MARGGGADLHIMSSKAPPPPLSPPNFRIWGPAALWCFEGFPKVLRCFQIFALNELASPSSLSPNRLSYFRLHIELLLVMGRIQLFWIEQSGVVNFLVVYRLFKVSLRSRLLPLWMDGCKTPPPPHLTILCCTTAYHAMPATPYHTTTHHTTSYQVVPQHNIM